MGRREETGVRIASLAAAVIIGSSALTGCSPGGAGHPGATVVASTGVWGSVARAVVGGHLPVKALLTNADDDPHSYQASPSDAAALVDASLVVYNGGGYDPWVDAVLAGHHAVTSVAAFALLANPSGPEPNEHVFYDLDVAKAVATAVADRLSAIDPANAGDYRANAAAFCRGAETIAVSERAIANAYPGVGVITTEPVAFYLLRATGLVDRTPTAFTAANENEVDPTPADMATVLNLIEHRQVAALLVNPQTATRAIDGLRKAARAASVPAAEVTETLPVGTDYLSWQRNTVNQLLAALNTNRQLP
jgi:zinc/manganese transport system substrate-binding protein